MRIVIPSTGSRGDVQPYLALALGLQAAGHKVRLATHSDFADWVTSCGIGFFPIEDGARALHETEAGQRMIGANGDPFAFMRWYARLREPLMAGLMSRCLAACRDADLILVTTTAFFPGHSVAEKLGVPAWLASLQPTNPSRDFPNCLFPDGPRWPGFREVYNLGTHFLAGEYWWQQVRSAVNQARQQVLGLPPLPFLGPPPSMFSEVPTLYGFSAAVLPRPTDWGPGHEITGYWFLDHPADWRPPSELVRFLETGSPPVCAGFGSMRHPAAEEATALVEEALEQVGQRGILLTGWGGLARYRGSDRIFVADSVPHDWLFPRTAAVVHHGGAGTTAAACRAGVPSVIVPFMADQSFWGHRIQALGVGPAPIPRGQLSVERLAHALHTALSDPIMRRKAAALGERLRAEDGVARAVAVVQENATPRQPHPPWPAPKQTSGDHGLRHTVRR
ncbi:MAG TPA: glycosyltransferase [Gemmataceae bacterium]|nr:glycosyltransferase [Gemmataceae bacterium]